MDLHTILKSARKDAGKTAKAMAAYLGVSPDMIMRYESGRSGITLETAARYVEFLGLQLGDILPGTITYSVELQPFLSALQAFDPEERSEILLKAERDLRWISGRMFDKQARDIMTRDQKPQPKRTVPSWSHAFPVHPSQFKERDFSYPLEFQALHVEELQAARGETSVNSETGLTAYTRNAKDARDAPYRVIQMRGDSMSPDYEDGWKVLIDTRKRQPGRGDPVAIYIDNEGGVFGYWTPRAGDLYLDKANPAHLPVKLGPSSTWGLIGTAERVVEAPVRRLKNA